MVRKIVHLRWKERVGPIEVADRVEMASFDRATGEPIRRCEHGAPGTLINVDVKTLDCCSRRRWMALRRARSRAEGLCHRMATDRTTQEQVPPPLVATCYAHTAIDDHARVAYVEAHDDETKGTAVIVPSNAVSWLAQCGVIVHRVLSDNGGAYRSILWLDTCAEPAPARPSRAVQPSVRLNDLRGHHSKPRFQDHLSAYDFPITLDPPATQDKISDQSCMIEERRPE